MPPAPPLERHIDLCVAHARGWIEPALRATHERLLTPGHASTQGQPRTVVAPALELLQTRFSELAHAFEQELARQLRAEVAPRIGGASDWSPTIELQLVDEEQAAEQVEMVRTIQWVEGGAEWELRELQARTATLRGQTTVGARSNPLRPEVLARSLFAAATSLGVTGASRRVLLRAASEPLTPAMQQACRDANGWLAQWGIEPAAWKVSSVASARLPGPAPSGFDVTRPGALDELRSIAQGRGRAAPAPSAGSLAQRDSQALLARLFECMRHDPRLSAPIVGVIARVQGLAESVAASNAGLLDDHAHPVWRMLNRVAGHALGYDASDDPRLLEFLKRVEPWIAGLTSAAPTGESRLVEAAASLESLCLDHLRAEQQAFGSAIERLRRAGREDELAGRYRQALQKELSAPGAATLSPSLRAFLVDAWCAALGRLAAREGEATATVQRLATLPTLLIASLEVPHTPLARSDLIKRLPALAATLNEGLALTTLSSAERRGITDELLARHTELLKPGARTATADRPEDIVRRMREENIAAVTEAARAGANTVIDESQLDTLPAPMLDEMTTRASRAWLDKAQPGLWCHVFLLGAWRSARLMWVSPTRTHWLFASDPGRSHSLTTRAVERLAVDGLLAPLEERNLLERAVDALLAEVRKPAR
jgi:hypothetical protein